MRERGDCSTATTRELRPPARAARGSSRATPPASQNTTSASSSSSASAARKIGPRRSCGSPSAIDFAARIERREIERREPVGGRQRVHREQPFRRAVEAGRMIGGGAAGEVRRHRPRGRGRRRERAEAVEHAARRHHLRGRRVASVAGSARRGRAGERDDALEHVDERARQRQVRPARVGGDVEQHDQALAARAAR